MEYVSQEQFTEFGKTVDAKLNEVRAENSRQNHRIEKIEDWSEKFSEMQATLKTQGDSIKEMTEKINKLVEEPGNKWKSFMGYLGTAAVSLIVGYLFNLIL